jgi:hypothetical protein
VTPRSNDSVFVGGHIPLAGGIRHSIALIGSTRTGKSLAAKRIVADLAYCLRADPELDATLVTWDPKRDVNGLVSCFPDDFPFFDVDFLSRGRDWFDLLDVESLSQIREVWEALLPTDPNEHQKYFPEKARQIAAAVHTCFHLPFRPYTLRDVVLAIGDVRKLRLVLSSHPYGGKFLIEINETQSALSVLSQLSLTAGKFEEFAALRHHQRDGRRVTAAGFCDHRRAGLILPYRDDRLAVIRPVVALACQQLQAEVLVRNEKGKHQILISTKHHCFSGSSCTCGR